MTAFGVFARTFPRDKVQLVAEAVAAAGYATTQLNLSSFGLPTLPKPDGQPDWAEIAEAFDQRQVGIWGVSATFNAIDQDQTRRASALHRACSLIHQLPKLDRPVATLCTGSFSAESMWTYDPRNRSDTAWSRLRATLDVLLEAAGSAGVVLGIEPEPGNVISDAARASRLLRELGGNSFGVGIVLDPANLVPFPALDDQDRILRSAFELLGDHVIALHAKDSVPAGDYTAVGNGGLDYELIAALHQQLPREVPVIVQDCTEEDAPIVLQRLRCFWGGLGENAP